MAEYRSAHAGTAPHPHIPRPRPGRHRVETRMDRARARVGEHLRSLLRVDVIEPGID